MTGKLKTVTLGCKVNQYETQLVREGLVSAGFDDATGDEQADLCIVNTCTVTAEGDSKSRQTIRRLHRDNPDARIVVMGCFATRAPDEVAALPGVVEVIRDKREIPDLLGRHGVIDAPKGITGMQGRTRAFVKIQDGCLLRCSYCIIPYVRPNMYSRPAAEVLHEFRTLIDNGFREIVLTGIHLGHYGVDFNQGLPRNDWTRLSSLLRQAMEIPGDFRLRLSSIESTEVTRDLIDVMAGNPDRICPHLHVCVQSGSDSVLRRMKRRWSARQIVERCHQVAERLVQPAFSTDVIVGFPGETGEEFEQTLEVCREIGFSRIHVFPFSRRKGTPAAEMLDQVDPQVRKERCEELTRVETGLREKYYGSLVGSHVRILVEQYEHGNGAAGTSCRSAECEIIGTAGQLPSLAGQFVDVTVTGTDGAKLFGTSLQQLQ